MSDTISEMNIHLSRMVWFLSLALSSLVLYQMQLLLYLNDQEIVSLFLGSECMGLWSWEYRLLLVNQHHIHCLLRMDNHNRIQIMIQKEIDRKEKKIHQNDSLGEWDWLLFFCSSIGS